MFEDPLLPDVPAVPDVSDAPDVPFTAVAWQRLELIPGVELHVADHLPPIMRAVVREVAERMGHTPAVCRASYVHPRVIELFIDGELAEKAASAAVHEEDWRFAGRWPKQAEKTLVEVLAG